MHFLLGYNHPSFALPWRTLLPYLVALHLLQPGSAQLTVVAPSHRVTANVGQDVVLRCHLCPCKDAWSSDIRWILQRSSGIVHHYQDGEDLEQMEEYKGRTELLRDGLSDGNLDLHIIAVSTSDSGSYSCAVQDGDGYADAVVELEVSDPFSQIVHPWKVALAVVITLLVGSFVINVFLYRKKATQSRELKRKDAKLAELDEISGLSAANLKKLASKLNEKAEKVENCNSELKKDCEDMGSGIAELKKLNRELEKQIEVILTRNVVMKVLAAKLGTRDVKLELLAAKLGHQTKELVKQNSQFQRHFQHMDSSAVKQKKLVTKLEEHCNQTERRNVKLEAAAVKVGHKAKESEERHEEMEQTEAVVVETEE